MRASWQESPTFGRSNGGRWNEWDCSWNAGKTKPIIYHTQRAPQGRKSHNAPVCDALEGDQGSGKSLAAQQNCDSMRLEFRKNESLVNHH